MKKICKLRSKFMGVLYSLACICMNQMSPLTTTSVGTRQFCGPSSLHELCPPALNQLRQCRTSRVKKAHCFQNSTCPLIPKFLHQNFYDFTRFAKTLHECVVEYSSIVDGFLAFPFFSFLILLKVSSQPCLPCPSASVLIVLSSLGVSTLS